MRFSKVTWIAISGAVWFIVGIGLLTMGLRFVVMKAQLCPADTSSLLVKLSPIAGGKDQAALILITLGLLIGFVKGRYILVKTIRRVTERILRLEPPIKISQVYSRSYLLLIGGMILLGMSLKWLHIPEEIRGTIDVAIGSALMNGALVYFRLAFAVHKEIAGKDSA